MSQFNAENDSGHEWEDRGSLPWGETQWRSYLGTIDVEIARFIALYQKFKDRPQHMEEVARLMGWARIQPQEPTESVFTDADGYSFSLSDILSEDEDFEDDQEPADMVMIHRQPLQIMTQGLYLYIGKYCEIFMEKDEGLIPRELIWDLAISIKEGERHACLGVHALDIGDVSLPICHFKRALKALNASIACLEDIPPSTNETQKALKDLFRKDVCRAFFDLRELWLSVMQYCREEQRRRA